MSRVVDNQFNHYGFSGFAKADKPDGKPIPFHERPPERLMADQYGKDAASKHNGVGTSGLRGENPDRKALLTPRRYRAQE